MKLPSNQTVYIDLEHVGVVFIWRVVVGCKWTRPARASGLTSTERLLQSSTETRDECLNKQRDTTQ